jgi:hypothetical protein
MCGLLGGVANAYIPTITTGTGEEQRRRGSLVGGVLDAQSLSDRGSSKDRSGEATAAAAIVVAAGPSTDQKKEVADLRP